MLAHDPDIAGLGYRRDRHLGRGILVGVALGGGFSPAMISSNSSASKPVSARSKSSSLSSSSSRRSRSSSQSAQVAERLTKMRKALSCVSVRSSARMTGTCSNQDAAPPCNEDDHHKFRPCSWRRWACESQTPGWRWPSARRRGRSSWGFWRGNQPTGRPVFEFEVTQLHLPSPIVLLRPRQRSAQWRQASPGCRGGSVGSA